MLHRVGTALAVLVILGSCRSLEIRYAEGVSVLGPEAIPDELFQLMRALTTTNSEGAYGVAREWERWMKGSSVPIVHGGMVTFVFFSFEGSVDKVALSASLNNFSDRDFLYRYGQSRLFYKTYALATIVPTEYVFYAFQRGMPRVILDPYNPAMTAGKPRRSIMGKDEATTGTLTFFQGPNPLEGMVIRSREISVYTPPHYRSRPSLRYPVLYMQDGQNIWEGEGLPYGGWKLNTTADRLINEGIIEPLIIVGVANSSRRAEEYVGGSVFFGTEATLGPGFVNQARLYHEEFRRYLAEVVKPYIDAKFRTLPGREHTAIGGSSFGAGFSISTAFSYPQLFSKIAALSGGNFQIGDPQWEVKPYSVYPWLVSQVIRRGPPIQIWLDCGTEDVDATFLPRSLELRDALLSKGWRLGSDLKWMQDDGAGHNEAEWAERFPEVLMFLFPKP